MENLPSCLPDIVPTYFYTTSVNMRGPSAPGERSGRLCEVSTAAQISNPRWNANQASRWLWDIYRWQKCELAKRFIWSNSSKWYQSFTGGFSLLNLLLDSRVAWSCSFFTPLIQYFESRMDISFLRRGRVKCLVSFGEVINEELLVKFWFLRRERSQSLLTREALLFYRSDDHKTSRGSSSNSGSSC